MPKPTKSRQVEHSELFSFLQAIVRNDLFEVEMRLKTSPSLARESLPHGATREVATDFFFEEIHHYLYAGDTPLHAAAAGYCNDIANMLLNGGADVTSRNRRGAEPLHYAADGSPGSHNWNPQAQAAMIHLLVQHGANPNALDKSGVAPLHRAVRHRSPSSRTARPCSSRTRADRPLSASLC